MRHRRIPNIKRRRHKREPKKRFFIFCEGKNTEPAYFKSVRRLFTNALIEVETVAPAGVPATLANQAVKKKKSLGLGNKEKNLSSFEEKDEVWAVFDRDEHPSYYQAIEKCMSNGIGVGRSNPCFEIWLILHIEEYNKPDDRNGVQGHLQKLCSDYDLNKGKTPNCDALVTNLAIAEKRAQTQFACREREAGRGRLGPPYTTVDHLTHSIRKAAEQAQ